MMDKILSEIIPKLIHAVNADRDAADYFRGIVKAGEMSERVLDLTEHIIRQNPAHYSAW
jgi:protein farnesyltransferase/geranylgeranyltransferase type-1 subunit alpha